MAASESISSLPNVLIHPTGQRSNCCVWIERMTMLKGKALTVRRCLTAGEPGESLSFTECH